MTTEVVGSELAEDVVMDEFRTSVKRGNSRPASVADDDEEESADDVSMNE